MYNNPSDPYSQYPGQQPVYPPSQPVYPPTQPGYPPSQSGYPQAAYPPSTFPQSQPGLPTYPPGYSQVGFPPYQPGYPQPRKSRIGLWITLVVLVLLLGGGSVLTYSLLRSTPQKTVSAYCDGLQNSNTQEIYDNLSSAQQGQFNPGQLQQTLGVFQTANGVKNCTLATIQENDPAASGSATVTFGNGNSQSEKLSFIQENGTWKINNMPISTPQQTLQNYCTALERSDAQGLYNTLSAAAQGQTSVGTIQTNFQDLNNSTGGITNCVSSNFQQNGASATGTITITPGQGSPGSILIRLVAENGVWKIDGGTAS